MKIGDKVICIDNSGVPLLKNKGIYTIAGFKTCCTVNLKLEEISLPLELTGCTTCGKLFMNRIFRIDRFRKLETELIAQCLELVNQEV